MSTERSVPRVGLLHRIDATTLLTVYLALLLLIPSDLVVGPLGAAGSPAQLLGMGFALAVLAWRCASPDPRRFAGTTSISAAALAFAACTLVSYVEATIRPIGSTELSSADRGLLTITAWWGVLFLALYSSMTRERLRVLLHRLVVMVGAVAVLGIVQFATGQVLVDQIQIPGLVANSALGGVTERSGFTRPAGTAGHPIEFGVVLAMALPLALHFAMSEEDARSRLARWWPVAAIALAIPQSLSRSAIVCVVVALACVMPGWTPQQRRRGGAGIVGLCLVLYLVVPGMLGTLTGLFTGLSDDGSTASRTDSYGLAFGFVERAPWFGRGLFTWLPAYRILDNQYLGLLIEVGYIGTAVLLSLLLMTIVVGIRTVESATSREDKSLARAMTSMVVVCVFGFATFDAFGFPMVPGLLVLIIGLVGAARGVLGTLGSGGAVPGPDERHRGADTAQADPEHRSGTART